MYHSLIIGGKNTYSDFGLIPISRPVISPPEPKVSYLEIPGRNGVLDLTETLTGTITYENRQGSWKFLVDKNREWSKVYSELLSFIQGRFLRVILEDDPLYYYEGRLSVNEWSSEKNYSVMTISYNLDPFKYEVTEAKNDGYQKVSKNLATEPYVFTFDAHTKVIEAIVTCGNVGNVDVVATIGNIKYPCKMGVNILPIFHVNGKSTFKIEGNLEVVIQYRKGRL